MAGKGRVENLKPFQFEKGTSGNPGGRPKGFRALIEELCGDDFEKIAQGLYVIAFGAAQDRKKFFGETVRVSAKDRIHAMVELRDSGPGRPAQMISTEAPSVPIFALPPGCMPRVTKEGTED